MSVYVDSGRNPLGRMLMCHMLADTTEELHAMAEMLGLSRKWVQYPGEPKEHYDLSQGKRALAVKLGAKEIDSRMVAELIKLRRSEQRV